jgi:hypothetical protein
MRRNLERRLGRAEIAASATWSAHRQVAYHREALRIRVAVKELIRVRLQAMGIDPMLAPVLRRAQEEAATLAGIPGAWARAPEAGPSGPHSSGVRDRLSNEIARIADGMAERLGRGEKPIDCSLLPLLRLATQRRYHNQIPDLRGLIPWRAHQSVGNLFPAGRSQSGRFSAPARRVQKRQRSPIVRNCQPGSWGPPLCRCPGYWTGDGSCTISSCCGYCGSAKVISGDK